MAVETKEKKIDNCQVMVTQYPGTTALFNKMKILKLLGPGIGDTLGKVDPTVATSGDASEKLEVLVQVIGNVCATIDPEQFTVFILELFKGTRIKPVPGGDFIEVTKEVFDLTFAGELLLMYKILWFVLEVNYGNFFGKGGLGEMLKRRQPAPPSTMKK